MNKSLLKNQTQVSFHQHENLTIVEEIYFYLSPYPPRICELPICDKSNSIIP